MVPESNPTRPLRIAFLHPDLGIGGAERLVVDAALGLQDRGHSVDLYTSYHDPSHCFEETKDGTLKVHHIVPPFPRSLRGKFHILFAHLRQLHLTFHLLFLCKEKYDVYFVDQLSTCVPLLRWLCGTRVVFYCHFPDKLLANGAFFEGNLVKKRVGILKYLYRLPMDWLEEVTTRQADIILANSHFTARIFKSYFPSIVQTPRIVYPGINISAYQGPVDESDPDIRVVSSSQPTLLSLNRFEGKKNAMLALQSFAMLISSNAYSGSPPRLVLAGGYDHRLADNVITLESLVAAAKSLSLSYIITSPKPLPAALSHLLPPTSSTITSTSSTTTHQKPTVLFLLNFTTAQRTALLLSPSTRALLYTPANEHFGIVPVEAMVCGIPVVACDSGGPTESVVDPESPFSSSSTSSPSSFSATSNPSSSSSSSKERTGWLVPPTPDLWSQALHTILSLSPSERDTISRTAKARAERLFGMEAMARSLEEALSDAFAMGPVGLFGGGGSGGGAGEGGWQSTVVMILIGFLVAYLVGPFVLPS